MPKFNGTGPWGQGPGTGWGMGPCGAGMDRGRSFGRGYGRKFACYGPWGYPYDSYQPKITKKEEREILEEDLAGLEEEIKIVKTRLSELKGQK